MGTATLLSLRDRMVPPAARRSSAEARSGTTERASPEVRTPEVERVLNLAADLFGVAVAALVLAGPGGFKVEAVSRAETWCADDAVKASHRLFEVLATEGSEPGRRGGVLEEVAPGRGFLAATPILSPAGRCLGAVCLMDAGRVSLLTGLQRRLFAEFGDLVAPALGRPTMGPAARNGGHDAAARLQAAADAEPDAFALFDPHGRCLLRNATFDALLGAASAGAKALPAVPEAEGCEASWIALHLARDCPPVGVYRAALADGTWLSVEERRSAHGRSLLARTEARDAFGGSGDMQLLFERCPLPMFVFDRDTRAILAVNAAALDLYGWDRDAFLNLDLDGIGPVETGADRDATGGWTHRTRDGRSLSVLGRTIGLDHRGRPAVLVTVLTDAALAGRAA